MGHQRLANVKTSLVAAAGGDLGSWLHQGTQASCRPLPQTQLEQAQLVLTPHPPSGIQETCTRTSFTLAPCAWRLGQQGNQGSREKPPSVMENRSLKKIQLQSNPALEAEVLMWMVHAQVNSSSLPGFTAVNRAAYSTFGVIQFPSSPPAPADDFPTCCPLTSTHSHPLFGPGWSGRPQANGAKANSLYLGMSSWEDKSPLL